MSNGDKHAESSPTDGLSSLLQRALIGACTLIIGLAGALVGVWGGHFEKRFDEFRDGQRAIWQVLNDRASIPSRTAELEKRTDEQERRIRDLEITNGRSRH